ncbi:hypothetical protein C2G38_2032692 [Gigaspora rosea]|uniref:Uncharacterized protein n=1 Tax=Gigaspora rosea TaxID=44941 RepID=A0A397VP10_9GLOM|nr:hypothetical protein C2G38_2032692 [Gigaspora rosea]
MSVEKNLQLQSFLMDKANVVMSSYKTDPLTNEPVYYLKNSKDILWSKFHEEYPDGMRRTSFYTRMEKNKYIYREDLGGLCHTCSQYGYEIFSDLTLLIQKHVAEYTIQISYAINQHIRLGFDVIAGQDIENAIKGIKGTSVANLNPNQNREENQLAEDVKKARIAHNEINNSFKKNDHTFKGIKFPLNLGWALKVNQKFGKKGARKRISPEIRILLEGYFLAEGEIKMEKVPKVSTIQNWIGCYTHEHKQEAAAKKVI